jgi:hypothetical protein
MVKDRNIRCVVYSYANWPMGFLDHPHTAMSPRHVEWSLASSTWGVFGCHIGVASYIWMRGRRLSGTVFLKRRVLIGEVV